MKRLMIKTWADTKATSAHIRRFREDEEGGMIIFSLFMFVLILAMAGMAVDLMRFETTRAKLQGCVDRAVLAAADLDQTIAPRDVVADYFEKCGMADFMDGEPVVQEGINYRVVSASGRAEMPTFFFGLPNFLLRDRGPARESLTVASASTAEERVTDVEISLVLDVSGSMGSNQRIQNLRPAARSFVTTVLANNTNAPQGLITISMVPYSAVVSTGETIAPYLPNLNRTHDYSTCPLFNTSMFSSTALNLQGSYDHVGHFDPGWNGNTAEPIRSPWCHVGDHNAILPVSSNETALHTAIDALTPYGNTAIDMGVKWGAALLDPSTRNMITALSATSGNTVAPIAQGRPYDFNQASVLKVMVLMTDGANTQQYDMVEPFKSGLSYVWFNLDSPGEDLHDVHRRDISVQVDGYETLTDYTDDWFYISRNNNRWRNFPKGYSSNAEYAAARTAGRIDTVNTERSRGPLYANNVRNASWQDLHAEWVHDRINNEVLQRAYNHGYLPLYGGLAWTTGQIGPSYRISQPDYYDADHTLNQSLVNSTQANARLSSICAAARAQGIIIYTVAFEAPWGGQQALQDCASSPSHYFDVDGTDISAAFSAIATDIRALKLTQ